MRPHAQSTGSTWLDTDRVSFRPAFAFADAEILCDCMLAPNRSLVLRECVCGAAGHPRASHTSSAARLGAEPPGTARG